MTRVTAMLSGSDSRTVVPTSLTEVMATLPPAFCTPFTTTSMPTPRPDRSETCVTVEKPGSEHQVHRLLVGQARRPLVVDDALGQRGSLDHFRIDAAPVVDHLDDDLVAFLERPQQDGGSRRLADVVAVFRQLRCHDRWHS